MGAQLKAASAPPIDAINVTEPEFFKAFDQSVASAPVADLKTYLRWHAVHASATVLSAPFINENFRFYGTTRPARKSSAPLEAPSSTRTAISAKRSARPS